MKININRLLAAALLPALLLAGCSRRDEATIGSPSNPLLVVLSPAHAPVPPEALDVIKKRLEAVSGLSVDLKTAKSPAEAISTFGSGQADAGLVTLEEFLVAREEYGVHAELQALRGANLAEYDGVLLARAKDAPAGVQGLAGKKVGFMGPYSVSGFTLPAIYLKKAGVKVQSVFSASHEENLKKLLDGQVDAAATYARQAARAPGLKVLCVTGSIPNEPVVTRRGLSKEKRDAVKAAFLALSSTPEGLKALGALADITGFRSADENAYKPLHDLLRSEGQSVYDLVPQGWNIYRLNQEYIPDR